MPLPWEATTKLMRLQGIAEELLMSSRTTRDPAMSDAVHGQLGTVVQEAHTVLSLCDDSLAAEFDRVVGRTPESAPAELRAAALVGWLRAELNVESLEGQREHAQRQQAAQEPRRRKQTIGFKIRSPVTREPES